MAEFEPESFSRLIEDVRPIIFFPIKVIGNCFFKVFQSKALAIPSSQVRRFLAISHRPGGVVALLWQTANYP